MLDQDAMLEANFPNLSFSRKTAFHMSCMLQLLSFHCSTICEFVYFAFITFNFIFFQYIYNIKPTIYHDLYSFIKVDMVHVLHWLFSGFSADMTW
jgi:hypothetical protein